MKKLHSTLNIFTLIPLLFLQACFPIMPHINHSEHDSGYALPSSSDLPWLSLNNGLDIYGWHDCYGYILRGEKCGDLSLIALPTGQKPDWKKMWTYTSPLGMLNVSGYFEQAIFAHRDTDYRMLGIINARHEIALIRPALDSDNLKRYGYPSEYAVSIHLDIWHNNPACNAFPIPRFVAFDNQHIWIFGEENASCRPNPDNYFAPSDLIKLNGASRDNPLLQKSMQLFYLDLASQHEADFSQPRLVTRDAKLVALNPRARIAFDKIALPQGDFQIDTDTSRREIINPSLPTQLCHYSRTEFFLTVFDSDSVATLRHCQPYTDAAMDAVRTKNAQ